MNSEAMNLLKIALAMIPLCVGFFAAGAIAHRRGGSFASHIWRTLGGMSVAAASSVLLAAGMLTLLSMGASD